MADETIQEQQDAFFRALPEVVKNNSELKGNMWEVSLPSPIIFPSSGSTSGNFRSDYFFFTQNSLIHHSPSPSRASSPVISRAASPTFPVSADASDSSEGFSETAVYQHDLANWIETATGANQQTAEEAAHRVASHWNQAYLGLAPFLGSQNGKNIVAAGEKSFRMNLDERNNPVMTFYTTQLKVHGKDANEDPTSTTIDAPVEATFRFEENQVVFVGASISKAAMEAAGITPRMQNAETLPSNVSLGTETPAVSAKQRPASNASKAMTGVGLTGATGAVVAIAVLAGLGIAVPIVGWALLATLALASAAFVGVGIYKRMQENTKVASGSETYPATTGSELPKSQKAVVEETAAAEQAADVAPTVKVTSSTIAKDTTAVAPTPLGISEEPQQRTTPAAH